MMGGLHWGGSVGVSLESLEAIDNGLSAVIYSVSSGFDIGLQICYARLHLHDAACRWRSGRYQAMDCASSD